MAFRTHTDFANAHIRDEGAVSASEISNPHALFCGDELGVDGADLAVFDDDLARRVSAHDDGILADLEPRTVVSEADSTASYIHPVS